MSAKLLVIDDDPDNCRLIRAIFKRQDIEVIAAYDGNSGIASVSAQQPDAVLLDLKLGDEDGLVVLEKLKVAFPSLPVIMLTAETELKIAVRATRLGAFDYLTKPIDNEEIRLVVRQALGTRALALEVEDLRRQLSEHETLAVQMGGSPQIRQVIEQVHTVAASNFTVLIVGETGAGKELVAQAIHRQSERRRKPFVAIDCGAIPEALLESELFGHERGAFTGADRRKAGRFELAEGGTIFLDEIGNLPMSLQAKLLRVLESRAVQSVGGAKALPMDVRFIAATNDDLQARVKDRLFRNDLYFRLAQYAISLPPLRERPGDIDYLSHRFLEEASVELRRPVQEILPDALEVLERHRWPGNVRELRNVIRQAVLQTKDLVIGRDVVRALLGSVAPSRSPSVPRVGDKHSLKEIADHAAHAAEDEAIRETLRATSGNKTEAARRLKTDFKTLHLKMKKFGIRGRDFGA